MRSRPQRSQELLAFGTLALLLLVTMAAYARGLGSEFELDDLGSVQFNARIRHLSPLAIRRPASPSGRGTHGLP
jgi:hypothetical protein